LQGGANTLLIQGLDYAGSRVTNATATITVTNLAAPALQPIRINEWLARNRGPDGLADPVDGDFEDWFELYNPNPVAVDLLDFQLTDDLSQPGKWTFTATATIPPQGYLLVWADGEPDQNSASPAGQVHVSFQLDGDGEAIGLFSPDGTPQSRVVFGPQSVLVSQGYYPDGDANGMTFMPLVTPGAANRPVPVPRITEVRVADGILTLSWSAVPGYTYAVLVTDQLDAPAWVPIAEGIRASSFSLSASVPLSASPSRFYRLRQD
jgi:hypothetical protein